jgi:hypothetical protein
MAYTDTALPVDVADALRRIDFERKGKSFLAGFGIAALIVVALGATYASYKDVPSPADPANGKGHLVTPYGY